MSALPTPRTDAELARLLMDGDLTNIDRREAMADFARLLENEIAKLGVDFAMVCRTNSENADAMIALVQANGEQRAKIEAQARHNRELQAEIQADSLSVPCSEQELAAWNQAAEKAGYINLRAWVIDTLTKAAPPHA